MASKVEITPDQARAILATEEGHFSDLKSTDIRPAKLTESVAAFANAAGGELFIGIAMSKRRTVPKGGTGAVSITSRPRMPTFRCSRR